MLFVVADIGLVLRGDGDGPDSLVTHLGYAAASAGLIRPWSSCPGAGRIGGGGRAGLAVGGLGRPARGRDLRRPAGADPMRGSTGRQVLVAVYAVFAVAAGARSLVQLTTQFDQAPLAYSLSAVAAAVYVVATVALRRTTEQARRVALVACGVEAVGVVVVGTLSLVRSDSFPDQTVWSDYGIGYGFVPLVLPFIGLWWLRGHAGPRPPTPPRPGRSHVRRALLVLITVSLLAATPAVAFAASTEKTDGDDTAMNLDLSKISMTLKKKKVIVAMRFHQDVANADLEDTGSVSVTYKIGPHKYRNAFVKTQPQGGVAGQICTYEEDDPRSYACSGFAAGRPSDRAVRFVIPDDSSRRGRRRSGGRGRPTQVRATPAANGPTAAVTESPTTDPAGRSGAPELLVAASPVPDPPWL